MSKEIMSIEKISTAVDALYTFRDKYFETHGIECAGQKKKDLEEKLEETLNTIKEHEGTISERAELLLQKGRALNVLPKYNEEAEQLLSSAIKLDPSLVSAWNNLGEAAWKRENVKQAKEYFEGALKQQTNKESLRSLSMAIRQQSSSAEERRENVAESVKLAKQAVALDTADGTSWYILGNAYLSEFFLCGQDPRSIKQCLSAYSQAEKDIVSKSNPDLHFNRGSVYRYEEKYKLALENYQTASRLDPEWKDPVNKEEELVQYLRQMKLLIETKGKMKEKKLSQLIGQLKEADLGPYGGGEFKPTTGKAVPLKQVQLLDLKVDEVNKERVILGKVVSSGGSDPFSFCMVDSASTCCAVTVYNQNPGTGVKIGDSVAIPEPFFVMNKIDLKDESIEYLSIRVASPLVLVVNGSKVSRDQVVPTALQIEVQPE